MFDGVPQWANNNGTENIPMADMLPEGQESETGMTDKQNWSDTSYQSDAADPYCIAAIADKKPGTTGTETAPNLNSPESTDQNFDGDNVDLIAETVDINVINVVPKPELSVLTNKNVDNVRNISDDKVSDDKRKEPTEDYWKGDDDSCSNFVPEKLNSNVDINSPPEANVDDGLMQENLSHIPRRTSGDENTDCSQSDFTPGFSSSLPQYVNTMDSSRPFPMSGKDSSNKPVEKHKSNDDLKKSGTENSVGDSSKSMIDTPEHEGNTNSRTSHNNESAIGESDVTVSPLQNEQLKTQNQDEYFSVDDVVKMTSTPASKEPSQLTNQDVYVSVDDLKSMTATGKESSQVGDDPTEGASSESPGPSWSNIAQSDYVPISMFEDKKSFMNQPKFVELPVEEKESQNKTQYINVSPGENKKLSSMDQPEFVELPKDNSKQSKLTDLPSNKNIGGATLEEQPKFVAIPNDVDKQSKSVDLPTANDLKTIAGNHSDPDSLKDKASGDHESNIQGNVNPNYLPVSVFCKDDKKDDKTGEAAESGRQHQEDKDEVVVPPDIQPMFKTYDDDDDTDNSATTEIGRNAESDLAVDCSMESPSLLNDHETSPQSTDSNNGTGAYCSTSLLKEAPVKGQISRSPSNAGSMGTPGGGGDSAGSGGASQLIRNGLMNSEESDYTSARITFEPVHS